jgi:phage-related protein
MPDSVRHEIGLELMRVQFGGEPKSFKPMPTVGAGAYEIRVRDESGAYRVIYVAKFETAVYVLHAFQKKSQQLRRWISSLRRPATNRLEANHEEEDRSALLRCPPHQE